MHKITLIGWSSSDQAVVEKVTYWPKEMMRELAIAKAAQVTDLMIFEEVLAEEEEAESIQKMREVLDEEEGEMEGRRAEIEDMGHGDL